MSFADIFKEPGGKFSHMRVLAVVFILLLSAAWFILSLKGGELQAVPVSVQAFVGILVGGNAVKRGIEAYEQKKEA